MRSGPKTLWSVMLALSFLLCCKSDPRSPVSVDTWHVLSGATMGTTYSIKYHGKKVDKSDIDSLLELYNLSLSNYIPTSTISQVNSSSSRFAFARDDDEYFSKAFVASKKLHRKTNGYFDPTISPLINYWGFGYGDKTKVEVPNATTIDSLKSLCGFEQFEVVQQGDSTVVYKQTPYASLNMNASAKGKGVDVVGDYLHEQGVNDYMVEIGGEVRTLGHNDKGSSWVIGINRPDPNSSLSDIELPVQISDMSMASSGNYRQFYKSGSITYGHIIDPYSGMSKPTDILSATIVAVDCETADAFATACMVMGLDKAKQLIESQDVEACLLYGDSQNKIAHWYSSGFDQYLLN